MESKKEEDIEISKAFDEYLNSMGVVYTKTGDLELDDKEGAKGIAFGACLHPLLVWPGGLALEAAGILLPVIGAVILTVISVVDLVLTPIMIVDGVRRLWFNACMKNLSTRDAFRVYRNLKYNIFKEYINSMQNIQKFCTRVKDTIPKLKLYPIDLIKNEINVIVENHIDEFKLKKSSCYNIIIIGKTGVGKSTLINKILELSNNKCAPVSSAKECTIEINAYNNPSLNGIKKNINLIDTMGINLSNNGVEVLEKKIKDEINKRISTGDPNQFVQCIWYCLIES